ncbi:hypothetical protein AEST_28950 [Alishewanella aestuarii B11]|uniref:Uncharacterized protein n=1 Tax=Alishewanella aestuarii B11 TaxID=1197174 RepID=J1QEZ5_9ALTE|nr:hypothetical protein AEST_28950 [Alishewanella aestuarii B11]
MLSKFIVNACAANTVAESVLAGQCCSLQKIRYCVAISSS